MPGSQTFKYLGHILSHGNNNVPEMRQNLKQAWATWRRISKILTREEIPAPVAGTFYHTVVVTMVMYSSKAWVPPPLGLKVLEGFHVEST